MSVYDKADWPLPESLLVGAEGPESARSPFPYPACGGRAGDEGLANTL